MMIRRVHRPRGFTLVEIIVALLISTLILGAAASVFVTATRGWERGNRAQKMTQASRSLENLIERHLRSAPAPSNSREILVIGEDLSDGANGGHRLTLISTASSRFAGGSLGGVSLVEFTFDPGAEEGFKMRVLPSPMDIFEEGGYEVILSKLVRSFNVRYFTGVEWTDNWFNQGLPIAVEFRLVLVDPDAPAPTGASPVKSSGAEASGADAESGQSSDAAFATIPGGYEIDRLVTLPMGLAVYQHSSGGTSSAPAEGASSR